MSIQELFQKNSYDLFADTVTANTFNGIVVPAVTSATTFTVGPPGPFTVNGTTNLNGTTNVNGPLFTNQQIVANDTINSNPYSFSSTAYASPTLGNFIITDNSDLGNNAASIIKINAPLSTNIGNGTNMLTFYNAAAPAPGNVFQVTSGGNINMSGSVNAGGDISTTTLIRANGGGEISGPLLLSSTGVNPPFTNGMLGYFANNPYDDVLSALNLLQLQAFPPAGNASRSVNENCPSGAWTPIILDNSIIQRTTYPGNSFVYNAGGIQDNQPFTLPIASTHNVLSLVARAEINAAVLAAQVVGIRIRSSLAPGNIVCQNLCPGTGIDPTMPIYCSNPYYRGIVGENYVLEIFNGTGVVFDVLGGTIELNIINFGNTP